MSRVRRPEGPPETIETLTAANDFNCRDIEAVGQENEQTPLDFKPHAQVSNVQPELEQCQSTRFREIIDSSPQRRCREIYISVPTKHGCGERSHEVPGEASHSEPEQPIA